jgi:hypothetical protein
MQTITPEELLSRLKEVKGSKIIGVTMRTNVKLLKKSRDTGEKCPYENVIKISRCSAMLGTDYEKGVNNRRDKEGLDRDFEAQEHSWADHTDKPTLSTNKEGSQYYANLRIIETYEVRYEMNGTPIDRELLREYEPKKSPPKNQGVEKTVDWRMPKVFPECSIAAYRSDGEEIEVRV